MDHLEGVCVNALSGFTFISTKKIVKEKSLCYLCVNALSGFTFISTLPFSSPHKYWATEGVFAYNYQNILKTSIFRPFF